LKSAPRHWRSDEPLGTVVCSPCLALMSHEQRKIYQSENGDSWWLCRGEDAVFVLHEANVPSGGMATRIELTHFLSSGRDDPEKRALLAMIGELAHCID
jgi:hypothetical protein